MAIEAARQMIPMAKSEKVKGFTIRDLSISRALVVPETEAGVETMFCLRPSKRSSTSLSDVWNDFVVYSWTPAGWNEHCRGLISTNYDKQLNEVDDGREEEQHLLKCRSDLEDAWNSCKLKGNPEKFYADLRNAGIDYGRDRDWPWEGCCNYPSTRHERVYASEIRVRPSNPSRYYG